MRKKNPRIFIKLINKQFFFLSFIKLLYETFFEKKFPCASQSRFLLLIKIEIMNDCEVFVRYC